MQAVDLFQQELLPELLKLAQDPVVNVRLALCRLLLEDQGPLRTLTSSAVSDPAEHIPVQQPHTSHAHSESANTQSEVSKEVEASGNGSPGAASGPGPFTAANAAQGSRGESGQSDASDLSSSDRAKHSIAGESDVCSSGGKVQRTLCQQVPLSQAESRDNADVTAWLLGNSEIRRALDALAKDVDPQVSLLAERGMLRDKAA